MAGKGKNRADASSHRTQATGNGRSQERRTSSWGLQPQAQLAASLEESNGSLELNGLLAAPAGAAQRLTARPFRALWLSAVIAVGSMWAGLSLAYVISAVPPSDANMSVSSMFM